LLIINLRIDEIGFQKILFLNFRNKDKRKWIKKLTIIKKKAIVE
jgi:hypothetical protein